MKNLKILKKAYCLNLEKIDNPELHNEEIMYYETRGKAKKDLAELHSCYGVTINNEPISFLNIPIKRCKKADIVLYKNKPIQKYMIEAIKRLDEHNKKLDDFLENDEVEFCYIRKHGSYYRWGYAGYTGFKHKAGIYSKEDAVKHCKNIIELECIPINIEEHNAILKTEIDEIKKGIIVSVNCR